MSMATTAIPFEGPFEDEVPTDKHMLVQFKNETGDFLGSPFDMPTNLSKDHLQKLCDALLHKVGTVCSVP